MPASVYTQSTTVPALSSTASPDPIVTADSSPTTSPESESTPRPSSPSSSGLATDRGTPDADSQELSGSPEADILLIGEPQPKKSAFSSVTPTTKKKKKQAAKRFNWSDRGTEILLEIYESHKYQKMFSKGQTSHKIIWTQIAKEVGERADMVDLDFQSCWDKLKYLKKRYKDIKKKMTSGSGADLQSEFQYFDQLDKLFNEDPTILPVKEVTELSPTEKEFKKPDGKSRKRMRRSDIQNEFLEVSKSTLKVLEDSSNKNAETNKELLQSLQTGNDILTALLSSLVSSTPPAQPRVPPGYNGRANYIPGPSSPGLYSSLMSYQDTFNGDS